MRQAFLALVFVRARVWHAPAWISATPRSARRAHAKQTKKQVRHARVAHQSPSCFLHMFSLPYPSASASSSLPLPCACLSVAAECAVSCRPRHAQSHARSVSKESPVCLLRPLPAAGMEGGSSGSNDPQRPQHEEWLWRTHDAIRADGRRRHKGPEPPSGQTRWHDMAAGGYRGPILPSPGVAPPPARARSRSPAAPLQETAAFGPDADDAWVLNEMAERLKTAYLSLGRRLAKFEPQRYTLIVCGRPVQAHLSITCVFLLPVSMHPQHLPVCTT